MFAVESALEGGGEGSGGKIIDQHRGPGERLEKSPVQAYRTGQRQGHQKFGQSLEHKQTIRLTRSASNGFCTSKGKKLLPPSCVGAVTFFQFILTGQRCLSLWPQGSESGRVARSAKASGLLIGIWFWARPLVLGAARVF